jgi:hypothetical protein
MGKKKAQKKARDSLSRFTGFFSAESVSVLGLGLGFWVNRFFRRCQSAIFGLEFSTNFPVGFFIYT